MDDKDWEKIISAVSKECEKNYEKHKETFSLAKKELIPFIETDSRSRVIDNWGTDEDHDEDICYSENGWIIFKTVVHAGAGVQKLISERSVEISNNELINKIKGCNLFLQIEFLSKAYKILLLSEYKSDLY